MLCGGESCWGHIQAKLEVRCSGSQSSPWNWLHGVDWLLDRFGLAMLILHYLILEFFDA